MFARSLGNIAFKGCCFWSNIQCDRQEYKMVKEPICWKIVGFDYILEPRLDKETNTLRLGNNAINYNSYFFNNSWQCVLVG